METKERIIGAALELFFRHGVKRITMDDIARHLSVSKKTIYGFFTDKDEIVQQACAMQLNKDKCEFETVDNGHKDAVLEIMEKMKHLHEMFSVMNPVLFDDLQKFHPKTWQMYLKFKDENLSLMIEKNLRKGIEQKLYRPDINIKIMVKLRIEEVSLGMNVSVFPPNKFYQPDVQVALLDHFLHGIVTVKGHKLINKYKNIKDED